MIRGFITGAFTATLSIIALHVWGLGLVGKLLSRGDSPISSWDGNGWRKA